MPQSIADDNEASTLARLISTGKLTGAGRTNALAALRSYDQQKAAAAPVAAEPATENPGIAPTPQSPADSEEPGVFGNTVQLLKRSGARLASGVSTLLDEGVAKAKETARPFAAAAGGVDPNGPEMAQADKILAQVPVLDPTGQLQKGAEAVTEKTKQWEQDAVAALAPHVRRAIELNLVERDEAGHLEIGEGAREPWWWAANTIDMGVQMAPGVGTAGLSARVAYGARFAEALAATSARKMPQSLAIQYAQKEAEKAAMKAATIAGGLTEGTIAGGMNAAQTEQTLNEIDEETLMTYGPYREMREKGLTHEVARAKIAKDKGLTVGLATAVATGLTGAPLNQWIARWAVAANPLKSRLAAAGEAALLEGSQEFVQEGTEQTIQNKVEQPITGAGSWDNVLESAITGGVLGAAMGGGGGILAGGHAKTPPNTKPTKAELPPANASPQLVETQRQYETTKETLAQMEDAAKDPTIRVAKADINAARETHQQAKVALANALLTSGAFDAKTQQAVAQALQQAAAAGIKPAVETPAIEGVINEPKSGSKGAEGRGAEVAPQQEKATAESKSAKASEQAALNEVETTRLDHLKRIATADTIEAADLTGLVSAGLAKTNSTGRPLLTPEGRKQFKALNTRQEAVEIVEAKAVAGKKPKSPLKKAAAAAVLAKPSETVVPKPLRDLAPTDLNEHDYSALERISTGKPVAKEEAGNLVRAGFVRERAAGDYAVKPAGRRAMRDYSQTGRQLPIEQEFIPVVEGEEPLRSKKVVADRAKAVQKDLAFTKRARQVKRAQRAAEIKKAADYRVARNQIGDQDIDIAEQSATTAPPIQTLGESFERPLTTSRVADPVAHLMVKIRDIDTRMDALLNNKKVPWSLRSARVSALRAEKVKLAEQANRFTSRRLKDAQDALHAIHRPPQTTSRKPEIDRAALKTKVKDVVSRLRPLVEKGNLTGAEAKQFRKLIRERAELTFQLDTPATDESLAKGTDTKSTLSPDVVKAATTDILKNRDVYLAFADHTAGTAHNTRTPLDEIVDGDNPNVDAQALYSAFEPTRAALRAQYGDKITLYRATGRQMAKSVSNWATTPEFAKQFGSKIIEREFPINQILAVRATRKGDYHEVVVLDHGLPPQTTSRTTRPVRSAVISAAEVLEHYRSTTPDREGVARVERVVPKYLTWAADTIAIDQLDFSDDSVASPKSRRTVRSYAKRSTTAPAVIVEPNGAGRFEIVDGFHRVAAARQRGETSINVLRPKQTVPPPEPSDTAQVRALSEGGGVPAQIIDNPDGTFTITADSGPLVQGITSRAEAEELVASLTAQRVGLQSASGDPRPTARVMRELVKRVKRELGADVQIADIPTDIPAHILPRDADPSTVKGIHHQNPDGSTEMWIVWSNAESAADAYSTMVHEIVGHHGLRALLGRKYGETMRAIRRAFPAEAQAAGRRSQLKWNHPNPRLRELHRNTAAEELVAYASERVLGNDALAKKRGVWQRIVTAMRAALRSVGWLKNFTEQDIEDLILRSRDHVRARGRRRIAEAEYNSEFFAAAAKNKERDLLKFRHFSNLTEDEVELSPVFMGTGVPGRERARGGPQVISLYSRDGQVEHELSSKTEYVVQVPRDSLYDASADPQDLRERSMIPVGWEEVNGQRTPNRYTFDMNAFERAIREAGYDGYHLPEAQGIMRGQARLFRPYPARRADSEVVAAMRATADGRLLGMPAIAKIPGVGTVNIGPHPPAREAARAYRKEMGIDTPEIRTYVRVNPKFGAKVAKAFESMKHDPKNPKVRAAYRALRDETLAQYQAIKKTGLKVELIAGEDPYAASPRMAIEDVKTNNHLWVFPTDAGFGSDADVDFTKDNPMLEVTEEVLGDRKLLVNDVFRIVHDYFGHIAEGNGFRADGEENAWRLHAGMYSDLARGAMTTETRGQNSWVNYGPNGEANRTASGAKTVYAPQKIGLLPEALWVDPSEQLSPARERAQNAVRRLAKYLTKEEKALLTTHTAERVVELFSELPSEKDLAAAAIAGQAKRGWYRQSAEALVNIFGPDSSRFGALLAALSPQTSVERNLTNAVRVWHGWVEAGRPTEPAKIFAIMGANVMGSKKGDSVLDAWKNNSVRALTDPNPDELTLSGPKVDSFARNLRGEVDAVTLDTWMANFALVEQRIFGGTMTKGGGPGKRGPYLAYSARVRQAAEYLSEKTGEEWTPAEVQETIWSWAKALYEESEQLQSLGGTAEELIKNSELTDDLINATPDFATLFQDPKYDQILRDAGYGEQLDQLAGKAGAIKGAAGQKIAPLKGDERRLLKAARRLDALREQRGAEAGTVFAMLGGNTGDPDLDSFLDKIGGPKRTLKQRWQDFTESLGDRSILAVFDHLHGIKRAENLAGISTADSGYVSARLSGSANELVQAMMEYGHPVWDGGAANIAGNMGLMGILKPLGNNLNLWLAYMTARRASRLMTEGRENLFDAREITAALRLGQQHPEFDVVARHYNDFQAKVLDFAQAAGIIDPQARALWEHADYIPFYRIIENGEVGKGTNAGTLGKIRNQIVRLRGGDTNIGDPLENIVRNWVSMMDASLKAVAARQTVDNFNGTGLVTRAPQFEITQAIIPMAQIKKWIVNNPLLAQTLQSVGLDPARLPPAAFAGLQKMMAVQAPTDEDVISVWRNGKREYWRINDSLLFQSLQGINAKAWGPLMEIFRFPKRLLTALVTTTPQFAAKNLWRDMWHVFVQGTPKGRKIPIVPGLDTVKGTISQIRMDTDSRSMLAGGGSFTHGYIRGGDLAAGAATIRRAIRKTTAKGVILDTPAKLWHFYRDVLNASENSHRVAVHNRVRDTGKTRKEALYESRDMLDFSMRGANPVVRFLIESVPFMNARLQGLYRLGRGAKADFVAVALRGMILTIATVALSIHNSDDERYKELTNEQKDSYWHIFTKTGHWKIPKPFEVGAIFATVPEAITDALVTNAGEPDAAKQALKLVAHTFSEQLNLSPQIQTLWPLLELAINKNTFTGSPILTQGDEGVLPEDQDGPRTSPTYRAIAQAMPEYAPEALRSPKQLEHLGRGYLGNLQDYVLLATDALVRRAKGEPSPPAKAVDDIPGLRDFRTTGPSRNNKYVQTMYQIADEAEKVFRSTNRATEKDSDEGDARVEQLETEKGPVLEVRDDFRKSVDQVNKLRQEQRDVQLDPNMTPDDKRQELDDLQQEINDVARDVYDLRPGGKLNPETAANLLEAEEAEQAKILKKAGLPATAKLLGEWNV